MGSVVRESAVWVVGRSRYVRVNPGAIRSEISSHSDLYSKAKIPPSWAQDYHFHDSKQPELSLRYILVLDCLNFCFWPLPSYEYHHLASSLKVQAVKSPDFFNPESLIDITVEKLQGVLLERWMSENPSEVLPESFLLQMEERVRLVKEIGRVLLRDFDGSAVAFVESARKSGVRLAQLVAERFPGFRDQSVYHGKQVFFYKRAQIFVGDVWGAFSGTGLGEFTDISDLTCFPDYRIPQLLREIGILKYKDDLASKIDEKQVLLAGSEEEVEIRAATVWAVELLREAIRQSSGETLSAIELDWILWERGEALLKELKPHHRVLTIFY